MCPSNWNRCCFLFFCRLLPFSPILANTNVSPTPTLRCAARPGPLGRNKNPPLGPRVLRFAIIILFGNGQGFSNGDVRNIRLCSRLGWPSSSLRHTSVFSFYCWSWATCWRPMKSFDQNLLIHSPVIGVLYLWDIWYGRFVDSIQYFLALAAPRLQFFETNFVQGLGRTR